MPSDALIGSLEALRETYTQRQRATNNLVTALKSSTGALGKASRALNDYAEQNPTTNTNGFARAQGAFASLRLKEEAVDPLLPDLRREVKTLGDLTAALKDALAALRGESIDVIKLGRAYKNIQSTKLQDQALVEVLPAIEQELQHAQRTLGETFGQALRHVLAEQGVEVGGRPPRFEIGLFEINADFVNRSAAISYGKNLVVRRVSLSVDSVINAYQRASKAIIGRNEDGDRWIEQFSTAWETARRKRGTQDQRANIVDSYYELALLRQSRSFRSEPSKHGFVDYSRAQFAYDFFEFANRQRREYRGMRVFGHTATKSQADSADKSIWIVEGPGPHDGRYIADVVFSKDE